MSEILKKRRIIDQNLRIIFPKTIRRRLNGDLDEYQMTYDKPEKTLVIRHGSNERSLNFAVNAFSRILLPDEFVKDLLLAPKQILLITYDPETDLIKITRANPVCSLCKNNIQEDTHQNYMILKEMNEKKTVHDVYICSDCTDKLTRIFSPDR